MQYNEATTQMQQMFVVSDCLLKLGYRKLAIAAQEAPTRGLVNDFVTLVTREASQRQDDDILDRLAHAGLICG